MPELASQTNLFFILLGLVVGLFGWLLYWAGLPLIGAFMGGAAGAALGVLASGFVPAAWAPIVLGAAGAILGAFLGIGLIKALQLYFFFVTGAVLGASIAYRCIQSDPVQGVASASADWTTLLLVGAGALVGGILTLKLRRFLVALLTAAIGSLLITSGVPQDYSSRALVVSFVVFTAVQVGLVRKYVDQEAFDRRTRYRVREDERPDVRAAD